MTDPYLPPKSADGGVGEKEPASFRAPVMGCVTGGCLMPVLLFFACAIILGDTGGPLLWPFIAVPLGVIGLVVGFIYRAVKR